MQNKINAKSANHKGNSRQNLHSGQTLNKITHLPSFSQEHESKFTDEVHSDKLHLFADKDLLKDHVFKTRENFITTNSSKLLIKMSSH